jgi:hypothetical protein
VTDVDWGGGGVTMLPFFLQKIENKVQNAGMHYHSEGQCTFGVSVVIFL